MAAALVAAAVLSALLPQPCVGFPRFSVAFAKLGDDYVNVTGWAGRLGNSLALLPGAICMGEFNGRKRLELPLGERTDELFKDFMRVPRAIPLDPHQLHPWGHCNDQDCDKYTNDILRDFRRVMLKYIKPLLKVPVDNHKTADDELLIHIRSGDSFVTNNSLANTCRAPFNNPPCAYYDRIIREGNAGRPFNHVRIVTEPDMVNPCIREAQRRNPQAKVVIQSKSVPEDAAAIINAKYFVATPSLFSKMLIMMNPNIKKVWYPHGTISPAMKPGYMSCGAADEPTVVQFHIPQICLQYKDVEEKKRWMVDYPPGRISTASTCVPGRGHVIDSVPPVPMRPQQAEAQPPRAEKVGTLHAPEDSRKVMMTFGNRYTFPLTVFVTENIREHPSMRTPMGSVKPGSNNFVIPAHHGRTFFFKRGDELIHKHSVDANAGEKQTHWIGDSNEL